MSDLESKEDKFIYNENLVKHYFMYSYYKKKIQFFSRKITQYSVQKNTVQTTGFLWKACYNIIHLYKNVQLIKESKVDGQLK